MARRKRYVRLFLAVHATARGVNGCNLFDDDEDKRKYLARFVKVAGEEGVEIHAYCILDNHVHFLLVATCDGAISRLFHRVHTWWAGVINRRYKRPGHLFQGRFFSCVLDKAHYWATLRYIDTNPRHHNLPVDWTTYEFSSARQHLTGNAEEPVPLKMDAWHRRFTPRTYRGFLEESPVEVAERLEKSLANGMPCGSEQFVRRLERKADRRLHVLPKGRPRKPRETLKTFTA